MKARVLEEGLLTSSYSTERIQLLLLCRVILFFVSSGSPLLLVLHFDRFNLEESPGDMILRG